MKPGNSQSIRKLRQNLEEWVMSAEEDETCEILDALLSYCDDMDHNYDYETANDKRARSVAGPQPVEKPGICVKHKPGFWRKKAPKGKRQMEQASPSTTNRPVF